MPKPTSRGGFPKSVVLGIFFIFVGGLHLSARLGFLPIPAIPYLDVILAVGSVLGGFYMLYHKFHRARIYVN